MMGNLGAAAGSNGKYGGATSRCSSGIYSCATWLAPAAPLGGFSLSGGWCVWRREAALVSSGPRERRMAARGQRGAAALLLRPQAPASSSVLRRDVGELRAPAPRCLLRPQAHRTPAFVPQRPGDAPPRLPAPARRRPDLASRGLLFLEQNLVVLCPSFLLLLVF